MKTNDFAVLSASVVPFRGIFTYLTADHYGKAGACQSICHELHPAGRIKNTALTFKHALNVFVSAQTKWIGKHIQVGTVAEKNHFAKQKTGRSRFLLARASNHREALAAL